MLPDGGAFFADPVGGSTLRLGAARVDAAIESGFLDGDSWSAFLGKGMTCTDPDAAISSFHEACREGRAETEGRAAVRVGFLADDLDKLQRQQALDASRHELSKRNDGQLFVHLWAFTPLGFDSLPDFACILSHESERFSKGVTLTLDASFPVDDAVERVLESFSSLPATDRQVVFLFHRNAMDLAGGPKAYAAQAFAWQSLLFRHGFTPAFIILVGPEDLEAMAVQFYEEICFSGIYPRNIHMNFVETTPDRAALSCEVYGVDHVLFQNALKDILARPTHGLLEPLALGYGQALLGAITRDHAWPRISFCPFTRSSMIFGGDKAGACPVALSHAAKGDTRFDTILWKPTAPDPNLQHAWKERGPHTVQACSRCKAAAFCGSGCPLRALEATGRIDAPDCPPVAELDRAIGHHVSIVLDSERYET